MLRAAAATDFLCDSLFARDPNLDPIRQDRQFQASIAQLQASDSLRRALFPQTS